MADEQFIQALQQAVKQEIIQNYFRERRIVEEEILLVTEAASAWLGGLSLWERHRALLGRALGRREAWEEFFAIAGLDPPSPHGVDLAAPAVGLARIRGLTRGARYASLIKGLYQGLVDEAEALEAERLKALDLMEEVNQDILIFESNHDLMMLSSYLRSLDPVELQRRKILGVNFTAKEKMLSAEALSFRPLKAAKMGLDQPGPRPRPVRRVMDEAAPLLKKVAREDQDAGREFL
ncbi:MAG: hypothetical protein K9K66_02510 [Desulfarculaceae bacterium]|nr:hypothetical protein [Desulfarculaceae bacterium]MCF8070921.1 hypothetical protein [Desulfarculaceae bacterium]MCF8100509.1 hypothetical protein [Desulfarculaceae bacterium]MCF8116535.1 hypothetical protein [Desulfarculaceae bacterium]